MPKRDFKIHIDIKPEFDIIAERFRSIDVPSKTQETLERYAFTVERFAKLAAPVDTGRLRASIVTDIGDLRARVAPHVSYAQYVEGGTRFMKAQPFLMPGLHEADAQFFGTGQNPFQIEIQKEVIKKLKF